MSLIAEYYLGELELIPTTPPSWPDAETRQEFSEQELMDEFFRQVPALKSRVKQAKSKYREIIEKANQR